MGRTRVGLVIPAWDEAESIGAVLSEVPPACVDDVLVVVGSAQDPTAEVAAAYGAYPLVPIRRGYGAACQEGARAAIARGAEIVAFLDGDYADPPAELPCLLRPLLIGEAELALGCRDLSACPEALAVHARLGNALVLAALGLLLGRRLSDLPSCKAIRAGALERLDMREMTYGWTVELVVKALRAGLPIAEVPIPYRRRLAGRSKVSGTLRGSLGAAWKLTSCAARYAGWRPAPGLPLAT